MLVLSAVLFIGFLSFLQADTGFLDAQAISDIERTAKTVSGEWSGNSFRRAIELYSTAADQWVKRGEHAKASRCNREAAQLHLSLGENAAALNKLFSSIHILRSEKDLEAQLKERASVFSILSLVYLKIGKEPKSKFYLDRSIEISAVLNDPATRAMAAFAAGEYFTDNSEFKLSLEQFQRAYDLWKMLGDQRSEALVLVEQSYVYMALGEAQVGLSNSQRAESIYAEIGDRRGLALSRIAVGHLFSTMGEKQNALASYLAAETNFPEELDLSEKGALTNGIGRIYEDYGEWDLSRTNRIKALAHFEKDGYLYGQLATLPSLVKLSFLLNDHAEGEMYFKKTEELSVILHDDYCLSLAFRHLGDYSFSLGEAKALSFFKKSHAISERAGYRENTALALERIGSVYERLGKTDLAKFYYYSSLGISRKIANRFAEAQTLYYLSRLEKSQGEITESMNLITQSLDISDSLYVNVSNSRLKGTYASNVHDRYELYVNLLMQTATGEEDVNLATKSLQAVEGSRARTMRENLLLSGSNFYRDAAPETVGREKEVVQRLNTKADKMSEILGKGGDKADIKKLESEINQLRNQFESIKGEIKQKSPIYSAIKNPAPFDVGEFQSSVLDDNSLLLEFSLGEKESYLWVVGKTTFDSYVLPPREQIEARVEKLRGLLGQNMMLPNEAVDVFQKRVADAEAEYLREARELSSELLGQAADKLAGKRLIVVADGKLHYFPLAALPFPNSASDDPIMLTNEVVYEPSAAAVMLIKKISASSKVPEKDLFLVSDPVYSKMDNRLEQNGGDETGFVATVLGNFRSFGSLELLPRLPASLEEAKSITDVVGEAATTGHTGFAANRKNVLNAGIGDYKVIHFATHGLLDEKRPELSGIALSLFDKDGQQQDGGFIRLQDVYGMDLNADLVVLSACDTGLGKEIKGEGLMSLNNAFLQSGAKSVVSSLWRVDDTVTKILMTDFYRGMVSEHLTSSQALRQAQIKLRGDPRFSSPFYWASFSVQGDFNSAPQLSRGYGLWIYFLSLGLISLGGIFLLRRSRIRKGRGTT
ncbi:MAG: CHAT domain-containing tetratricopeptide repeat protein [Pyrinomonadaceae bacterium]